MPKLPWFKFYPKDWMSDGALSIVTAEARGVAADLMCVAFDMPERGVFKTNGKPWTVEDIAHAPRGFGGRRKRCVEDLIRAGVLKQRETGEFYWARMVKDELTREFERQRKRDKRRES
jgi:hypothetical protein